MGHGAVAWRVRDALERRGWDCGSGRAAWRVCSGGWYILLSVSVNPRASGVEAGEDTMPMLAALVTRARRKSVRSGASSTRTSDTGCRRGRRLPTHLIRLAVLTASVSSWVSQAAAAASFSALGYLPGSTATLPTAVSGDGSVAVGWAQYPGPEFQAFRWTRGTGIEQLRHADPNRRVPLASAASFNGSVIVGSIEGAGCGEFFRWTEPSGFVSLGCGSATDISSDGNVVVGGNDGNGFRWTELAGAVTIASSVTTQGVSGDGSIVVGTLPYDPDAFRWTEATGVVGLGAPPGYLYSADPVISSDGRVIAGTVVSMAGSEAFRWTSETGMLALGMLGRSGSEASAVSGDGSVVVGNAFGGGTQDAVIWIGESGVILKGWLETEHGLDLAGWSLGDATGISDDGFTIVGYGVNPDGVVEGWIAVIPDPSTGLLLGAGLIALSLRRGVPRR